jgi:hypothetical protein
MITFKNGKMYQIVGQEWNKELNQWENYSRITFDLPTSYGTVSQGERQFIRAYPNPFSNEVIIESSTNEGISYSISNASGQIVHSSLSTGTRTRITLSHLPGGTYYLMANDGKSEQVIKLVKR